MECQPDVWSSKDEQKNSNVPFGFHVTAPASINDHHPLVFRRAFR
jgi:hypothetical protein